LPLPSANLLPSADLLLASANLPLASANLPLASANLPLASASGQQKKKGLGFSQMKKNESPFTVDQAASQFG
jgi:hypothetical protein